MPAMAGSLVSLCMSRMRYSSIYNRYLFRGSRAVRATTPGTAHVQHLDQPSTADWLEGNPLLVLDVKAAGHRCLISLDDRLLQFTNELQSFPCVPNRLISCAIHAKVRDMCRTQFGDDACIYILADRKYYCTRRGLRVYELEGLQRVTEGNVDEIMSALIPGIADHPSYIESDYLLNHGPAFAWYVDGKPVGFAGTHSSGMCDQVGNIGMVFVKDAYRGRGGAQALVSHVARALLEVDRLPLYGCDVDNVESWRTAESVGFVLSGYTCQAYVCLSQNE